MNPINRQQLEEIGFTIIRDGYPDPLASGLGRVIHKTDVRLSDKGTYLSSPTAVPFHTDHPDARYILWHCLHQDQDDGSTLLVDGLKIIRSMPAKFRATLSELMILCPPLGTLIPDHIRPFYSPTEPRIFFAPWLIQKKTGIISEALDAFVNELNCPKNIIAVRMNPGEALVIDNNRVLHGRDAIAPHSNRHLIRLWIGET